MRYRIYDDPFKDMQPGVDFTEILSKPIHSEKPKCWGERQIAKDEVDFGSIRLELNFKDEALDTAYDDIEKFCSSVGIEISNNGKPIETELGESECFEAYRILVTRDGCKIIAADTEGIRRAIYYIEDEMKRREGPWLPLGEIKRRPYIKSRVSRCYFTPSSHAAIEMNENELKDDTEYYPDEYLNRLAHDGINALWLGASLKQLVKSDIVPEYGEDSEQRMGKFKKVIDKCLRYGIKTYFFSVDPASSYCNDILLRHPEMCGDEGNNWITHLCPSTEAGLAYIKEAVGRVFTEAPKLAGYINLSVGESESHCASTTELYCKRCQKKFGSVAKALSFVEKTIAETIKEVAPHAEYVSWTYAQRNWSESNLQESLETRDPIVKHLVNFEDLGRPEQLGKKRLAYDYWLSYAGPGELFEKCIRENKKRGITTWAKIQTCSSHEISTVPYVPVPSLLYDKYKYMHDNGVDGVMQCWFFGNYPCLMQKAAGVLSFLPFPESKEQFLEHLAGIYWGSDAKTVAGAWEKFAEGYSCFPVGVAFEWFSALQDSPCAPYHLKPIDMPMPSTWLLDNMVGSDRVGDCIYNSHTLDEVITLTEAMVEKWDEGLSKMTEVKTASSEIRTEQYNVAKAISLIFRSGMNTYKFYRLRRDLGIKRGDPAEILSAMKDIVNEEIKISAALIPMTEEDVRIGYHSEAHGHKIFPAKLKWRIEEMKKLLETEFPEVEDRIRNGLIPLEFYTGELDGARKYTVKKSGCNKMYFLDEDGNECSDTSISVSATDSGYKITLTLSGKGDTVRIDPEFNMFHRTAPIFLSSGKMNIPNNVSYSLYGEIGDEYRSSFDLCYSSDDTTEEYTVTINKKNLNMEENEPFRLMISRTGSRMRVLAPNDRIYTRLIVGKFSPDAFAFFIPEDF